MQAVMKYAGNGNVAVMDTAEPARGDKQVKVEVAFCGVCGTDLHVLHDTFRNYQPVILGHEFGGAIGALSEPFAAAVRAPLPWGMKQPSKER